MLVERERPPPSLGTFEGQDLVPLVFLRIENTPSSPTATDLGLNLVAFNEDFTTLEGGKIITRSTTRIVGMDFNAIGDLIAVDEGFRD